MLPTVRDLALRLGADPHLKPGVVRLRQSGRMQQPGGTWRAFRARQTIEIECCAFDWRARMGPAGMLSVRDALTMHGGRLDLRLFGLVRLDGASGSAALWRGELMRYIAELAWAPDAILYNGGLSWRADGPDRFVVGTGNGETYSEVMLDLDAEGRIAGAFAPDRPRSPKRPFLPTPWQGRFSDYRLHAGRWLPFAGEVGWIVDRIEETYWQGKLETWNVGSS